VAPLAVLGVALAYLPWRWGLWVGRRLGDLGYWVLPGRRAVARANLERAFGGGRSRSELGRLCRESFRHLGMTVVECCALCFGSRSTLLSRVEVEGVRQTDGTVLAKDVKVERAVSEVQGTLSLLSGTCPAISFTAGTTKVTTAATTTFKGGNCVSLKNGDRVEVEGFRQTDGTVLAKDVRAVKTEAPVFEIKGRLSLLSGACPAISFTVGTTKVKTAAATKFKDATCAKIKDGTRVEVKGTPQTDGTLLATVVEVD
jgi:hypothetical protein